MALSFPPHLLPYQGLTIKHLHLILLCKAQQFMDKASQQLLGRALLDAVQPQNHTFRESYGEIAGKVQTFVWSQVTMQG